MLNRPVIKVFAEAMDGGAAEDDVGDALLANEACCSVGDAFAFDGEDLGVEVARELHVGGKHPFFFFGKILVGVDLQDEEFSADSFGHARAAGDEHLRGAVGTDADGDAFADCPVSINVFRVHVGGERAVDGFGHVLEGEFAECDQVAAAKEIGEGLFGAVYAVDIASAHAGLQGFGRQVGHHDLVGALPQPVGNGFANWNAGYALYGGGDALDVLHV